VSIGLLLLQIALPLGSVAVSQRSAHSDLHSEWVELAKKQLKGADPAKKLTWHTPEVCFLT
jgi:hypothetical protein